MILANFSYEFSPLAVLVGLVAAAGLILTLGLTGRRALSATCGGIGCAVIAFLVWMAGRGDIIGLVYLVLVVPLAGLGGAVASALAVSILGRLGQPGPPSQDKPVDPPRQQD